MLDLSRVSSEFGRNIHPCKGWVSNVRRPDAGKKGLGQRALSGRTGWVDGGSDQLVDRPLGFG